MRNISFLLCGLLLGFASHTLALVNPMLQPSSLIERYKDVVILRVSDSDDETATLTLDVQSVLKGAFTPKQVTLRADGDTAREAFEGGFAENQLIVAYVGKSGRRGAGEILFYLGEGHWGTAVLSGEGDPQPWTWKEDLGVGTPRSMFGTFNGSSERLGEMMRDATVGSAFFPAEPFTKFKQDREIAKLSETVTGVALYDLDGDGRLDIYASSAGGDRLFLQTAPLEFTDVTDDRGLKATHSPSVGVADVNGDGRPDLLLGGEIRIASDDGYTGSKLLPADSGRDVKCAAFAEINGDGWPDVIISRIDGGLGIYLHPGKVGVPYTDVTATSGIANIPECLTGNGFFFTGDWNRDGKCDLFYSVGEGLLLVQDAKGQFARVPIRQTFDFTTDGELRGRTGAGCMAGLWRPDSVDLAFAYEASVNYVISEDGKPVDAAPYGNELTEGELGLMGVLAEDLNADGNLDLYALNGTGNPNVFYLNRGYGSFMTPHKYQSDLFPGAAHSAGSCSAAAGDVDGDCANDLVLGGSDGKVTLILNDTLASRGHSDRPTAQQRLLAATALLDVSVEGHRGLCGAVVSLADASGKIVGRRVLGSQIATGSCGPSNVAFAAREPGKHTLTVRYSDGVEVVREVDLSKPGGSSRVVITRGIESSEQAPRH